MTTPNYIPFESFVPAALESLMEQLQDDLGRLKRQPEQGNPTVQDERKFLTRQFNAFKKALYYWQSGLRPALTPGGAWLVPSGSQAGAVSYLVERHGDVWCCDETCPAQAFHWHSALIAGLERAAELASEEGGDDGDGGTETDDLPTPIRLTAIPGGLALSRNGVVAVVRSETPEQLGQAIERVKSVPASWGGRVAERRRQYLQEVAA